MKKIIKKPKPKETRPPPHPQMLESDRVETQADKIARRKRLEDLDL